MLLLISGNVILGKLPKQFRVQVSPAVAGLILFHLDAMRVGKRILADPGHLP
jgi:hypothetical protein